MPRKKHNRVSEPLPLSYAKTIESVYPMIWTVYDECLKQYQSTSTIDTKCLPINICGNLYSVVCTNDMPVDCNKSIDVATIHAVGSWRYYKQVYSFDDDISDILINHNTDDISGDTLSLLRNTPYPSFYVECSGIQNNGFFFVYEASSNTVRFFTIAPNGTNGIAMGFRLDGSSLQEAVNERIKNAKDQKIAADVFNLHHTFLINAIQLVLYICSVNCDIEENAEFKQIHRSPKSGKPQNKITEVRKWNVGFRVGRTFRSRKMGNSITCATAPGHITSTSKRPHIRRGHYHRFWTGRRNGEQIAVLKWVEPVYVNMTAEELPAVVNII